eukprot:g3555.t1
MPMHRYKNMKLEPYLKENLSFLKKCPIHSEGNFDVQQIPFKCGYVGFMSYDALKHPEAKFQDERDEKKDSARWIPNATWLLADRVIAIDHKENEIYLLALHQNEDNDVAQVRSWMDNIVDMISNTSIDRLKEEVFILKTDTPLVFTPDRTKQQYLKDVKTCLKKIDQGETYEVCLTNQIHCHTTPPPLKLYKKLRSINPAPYAAFLRFDPFCRLLEKKDMNQSEYETAFAVCCSSPERYLRVSNDCEFGPSSTHEHSYLREQSSFSSNGKNKITKSQDPDNKLLWVESKPIKGTRKRSATVEEDRKLASELENSEKDQAENLMIVDLVRNDLGRVCRTGTVTVPKLMKVETYATVHQLVSTVCGQLKENRTAVDAMVTAFPGGSMTGAPKIRTMEIIESLEGKYTRGLYSGCLGFLSLDGCADLNIVIRTAVCTPSGCSMGSGGAIVALSDPEEEYEEMLLKVRPVMQAIAETTTTSGVYSVKN